MQHSCGGNDLNNFVLIRLTTSDMQRNYLVASKQIKADAMTQVHETTAHHCRVTFSVMALNCNNGAVEIGHFKIKAHDPLIVSFIIDFSRL